MEKLRRSRKDKKLAGVCGGIGQALQIDASYVRLAFLLLALIPPFSTLIVVLVYAGLAAAIPQEEA